MRETFIDGVPVFQADGPGPLSAGLVFGVGRADETFVRGGLTHLVEHLTMGALGRLSIEANASVDLSVTEFTATGPADGVVAFLRSVCVALADLPTDRLAVEADVLRTEGGSSATPVVGALLSEVFGMRGFGLAGVREPAIRSLTADHVREWARTWFHRSNAALWLSGPAPDGISLPLPDGPSPRHLPAVQRSVPTPACVVLPLENGVALGAAMPHDPALGATVDILRDRVEEELRHRRGVAYAVQADRIPVDAGTRFTVLISDVRAGQEAIAAPLLWREVQRLAEEGPQASELDHGRAAVLAYLDDPRSATDEVRARAESEVTGMPVRTSAELRADALAVSPEDVRRTAATLLERAILAVPDTVETPPPGLNRLPEWSPGTVTGREFARKRFSDAPKGARLVVGADGVSVALDETRRVTVRFAEAVGLVRLGRGEWRLFGDDGFSVPLSAGDWRNGEEAVDLVRAAVPAELHVVDDDADDEAGLLVVRAPAHKVGEAVGMSRDGATVLSNGEWTAVVPDSGRSAEETAASLIDVVGRHTVGLVLRRTHADLEYVQLCGARVIDRHRWGVVQGTASKLAEATWRPEADLAAVLGDTGDPAEILDRFVAVLGLPPGVPDLLAGRPTEGTQRFEGLGLMGGMRANARGDYLPPAGRGHALDAWRRLSATRPAWYRAVNALGAVVSAAVLWLLLTVVGLSGSTAVPTAMCVLTVLSCLWDTRPPRRVSSLPPAQQPDEELTPSG